MLGDGAGNASSTRVIALAVVIYLLVTHAALAIKTGIIVPFNGDELSLLGMVLGAKLFQNHQENQTAVQTKT